MGEKSKGRDSGKVKKPKAPSVGRRPHEERQRQEGRPIPTILDPVRGATVDRTVSN
jgi:hypothetical protein